MFDIYPYISNAVDWEYSMSSPAVSSTFAEDHAFRYTTTSGNKTYMQYRNVSMRLHSNMSLPEIESILILTPLYVTGIRLRINSGISGDSYEFNSTFRFKFCNVFLISYGDMVDGSGAQDIEISEFKINITAKRRNGGYILSGTKNILINNYWI